MWWEEAKDVSSSTNFVANMQCDLGYVIAVIWDYVLISEMRGLD
jgi:hypothetical protein